MRGHGEDYGRAYLERVLAFKPSRLDNEGNKHISHAGLCLVCLMFDLDAMSVARKWYAFYSLVLSKATLL